MYLGFKSTFLSDVRLRLTTCSQLASSELASTSGIMPVDIPAHGIILAQHSRMLQSKLQRWTADDVTLAKDQSGGTPGNQQPMRIIDIDIECGDSAAFEAMLQQMYLAAPAAICIGQAADSEASSSLAATASSNTFSTDKTATALAASRMASGTLVNEEVLLDQLDTDGVIKVMRLSDYYQAQFPAQQAARVLARTPLAALDWCHVNGIISLGPHMCSEPHMQQVMCKIKQKLLSKFGDLDHFWQEPARRELWRELHPVAVEMVLADPSTKAASEDTVLLLLADWVHAQPEPPEASTTDKLCCSVRWPLLSSTFMAAIAPRLPWYWAHVTKAEHMMSWLFVTKTPTPATNENAIPSAVALRSKGTALMRPASAITGVDLDELNIPQAALEAAFAAQQEQQAPELFLDRSEPKFYAGLHWHLEAYLKSDGLHYDVGVSVIDANSSAADQLHNSSIPQLPVIVSRDFRIWVQPMQQGGRPLISLTRYAVPLGSRYGGAPVPGSTWSSYLFDAQMQFRARVQV